MAYFEVWGRVSAVFITLLLITRVLGKREIGQLTFFDYVVGITIGSVGAKVIAELDRPIGPLWLAIVLLAVYGYLIGYLTLKSRVARRYVDGEPTVMVQNGKVLEENMRKQRLTFQELMTELRRKNVFLNRQLSHLGIADAGRVAYAVLNTAGQLYVDTYDDRT